MSISIYVQINAGRIECTNLSDISYNDRDEHSRNTNYVAEILTGSDADPSNAYRYKKVSKSLLRFKNVKMKSLFFELNYISMQGGYTELCWNKPWPSSAAPTPPCTRHLTWPSS